MNEVILLILLSAFSFLLFLTTFILGLVKKNKSLQKSALVLFFLFVAVVSVLGWKVFTFVGDSFTHVVEKLKPRTGEEIYDALFDKRETDCVHVLNSKDQVVPKLDLAIWLELETCPNEVQRILSGHDFTFTKLSKTECDTSIPYNEHLDWFKPIALGDTICIYEFATDDNRNIQTLWMNMDSTKMFVRDILD